jgi:hypothetical protein
MMILAGSFLSIAPCKINIYTLYTYIGRILQRRETLQEPWRAYSEMYHSGWLSGNDTAQIYSYQQNHDSLMRLGVSGGVNVNNVSLASGVDTPPCTIHTVYTAVYMTYLTGSGVYVCVSWKRWSRRCLVTRRTVLRTV